MDGILENRETLLAWSRKHLGGCFLCATLLSSSSSWVGCGFLLVQRRDCGRRCFLVSGPSGLLQKPKFMKEIIPGLSWSQRRGQFGCSWGGRRDTGQDTDATCMQGSWMPSPRAPSLCHGSCPQAWLRSRAL